MEIIIPVVILIAIAIAYYVFNAKIYNELVKRRNSVKNAWAHIDAQLQRRFDLVPSLVDVVQSSVNMDMQLFDRVTSVLSDYTKANTTKEKMSMDAQLTACLKSLYKLIDNYPQLKSSASFLQLQSALTEIEEDISYARQFYNDAVTIYNNKIMSFPANKIANKHGFKEEQLFDAVKEADNAPMIKINTRLPLKDRQCPVCGASITQEMTNCDYCGSILQ